MQGSRRSEVWGSTTGAAQQNICSIVETVVASEQEKKALLDQLDAYDMTDLDVYVLKQIA